MEACGIDYRTAYRVVGHAVREASAAGLSGADIDGALLDRAAVAVTGRPLLLAGHDLAAAADPEQIVRNRTGLGGAAPGEVTRMAAEVAGQAAEWAATARRWRETYRRAAESLVATARRCAEADDEELRVATTAGTGQEHGGR
jgi:argininosuccinate lyase